MFYWHCQIPGLPITRWSTQLCDEGRALSQSSWLGCSGLQWLASRRRSPGDRCPKCAPYSPEWVRCGRTMPGEREQSDAIGRADQPCGHLDQVADGSLLQPHGDPPPSRLRDWHPLRTHYLIAMTERPKL